LGEDQAPTTAKAAAIEEPIAKISAGAILSKNLSKLARDMTHTFEFEPRGSGMRFLFEQR
jgi:hypothetical protein